MDPGYNQVTFSERHLVEINPPQSFPIFIKKNSVISLTVGFTRKSLPYSYTNSNLNFFTDFRPRKKIRNKFSKNLPLFFVCIAINQVFENSKSKGARKINTHKNVLLSRRASARKWDRSLYHLQL